MANSGACPQNEVRVLPDDDLAHNTRRMLQALDGYWDQYEGYSRRKTRSRSTEEDWWIRFEKYRKKVEAAL